MLIGTARRLARSARSARPGLILVLGWLGFMLYAYPGYMSYDSAVQLLEARSGEYTGAHPPTMSALWAITDSVIAGPLGMLLVQSICFLAGAFLLLRRFMSARRAAACATLVLWFPPVSAVLAVIWKDSQMVAYLALGAALLLSPRRGVRIVGLALLSLATAMRYNALAITLPLVVMLFAWSPAHRWWLRYPIALGCWLLVTFTASFANNRLTADGQHVELWHDSLALFDLTGTLRYAPDLVDDELRRELAGTPLLSTTDIQVRARASYPAESVIEERRMKFGSGAYVPALWITTDHVFSVPTIDAQRAAIARAWRSMVLAHPTAYLEHRWHVFRERVHLGDDEIPSGAYIWFNDILDPMVSAGKLGHNAAPSGIQLGLRKAMLWLGSTWLFRPWIYLALSLVFVGLCRRDRTLLALVLSGIANEAALFVLAPTIDYRYSVWLVIATVVVTLALIATRAAGPRLTDERIVGP